ncbi:hypothetical protein LBYZC6_22820 [Lacrimispora brassicae]
MNCNMGSDRREGSRCGNRVPFMNWIGLIEEGKCKSGTDWCDLTAGKYVKYIELYIIQKG